MRSVERSILAWKISSTEIREEKNSRSSGRKLYYAILCSRKEK